MKCATINLFFILLFLLPLVSLAQDIPNGDFEIWAGSVPEGWMAVNPLLVSQSNDAHSGNHSVRLEIIEDQGILYNGRLYAGNDGLGFDYFQRPAALTGYYKLSPQVGDHLLVDIFFWKDAGLTLVGHKLETFPNPASVWTQFTVPITYTLPDDPDRCTIEISIGYFQDPGGMLWVDDLNFQFTSEVEEVMGNKPDQFELMQNYPNPFNPSTSIQFALPSRSFVKLVVYNALGEFVETLISEELNAGKYNYKWTVNGLPSGIYFYTINLGSFIDTKKLILAK